ncbi:MAG TPA: hypothetical protein VK509_17015 [Polyangiales bacterium]|nr:hypothetical protein [Polyangiales bacterium]
MSQDPERLLQLRSPGEQLERELLASIKQDGPPAHAKDEAWLAIAGRVAALGAAAGTAAAGTGSAAASSASFAWGATAKAGLSALVPKALAIKIAWTLAAGGVALGGYLTVQQARSTPARPPSPAVHVPARANTPVESAPAAAPTAVPAAPSATPAAEANIPVRASEAPPRRDGRPAPLDRLSAESALLAAARAQLLAGDARTAEATLARLRARFPHGVLIQEREVLAIELLAAQGRAAAAARRARAFARAYPQSPHSAKLNRFLDAP